MGDVLKDDIFQDSFPISPLPNQKNNDVAYMVIDKGELSTAYTYLTGQFPSQSSRGNKYILVGYHYDENYILAITVKDRKASTLTNVWKSLHANFAKAGATPNTYIIDNEISSEFIAALEENEYNYQLVPPHSH